MHLPTQAHAVMRTSSIYTPGATVPAGFWGDVGDFFTKTLPSTASSVFRTVAPVLGTIAKPLIAPGCAAACAGNPICMTACNAGGSFLAGQLAG